MGQVITIKEITRVSASDPVLVFIDECYDKLAALPEFVVRDSQRKLSKDICRALVAGEPIAAEAPTGTGKTIAYLIGGLAAAEVLRTTKDIPVVVGTATVGLQTQILTGDLPKLIEAGIVHKDDAVLAKGRGRYFCVANAERMTAEGSASAQIDFFDIEGNEAAIAVGEAEELLQQWFGKAWNGDIDALKGSKPSGWPEMRASNDTCLGHRCDHYNTCAFFNSRRALSSAKIIVANHDLVLSDLAMAKEGGDPLFPGSRYIALFDEAHHLPDKAVEIGSAEIDLNQLLADFPKVSGYARLWQKHVDLIRLLEKAKVNPKDFDPGMLLNALAALKDEVAALPVDEDSGQFRFPRGDLPDNMGKAVALAYEHANYLQVRVQDAGQALKQTKLAEKQPALKAQLNELLYQTAFLNSALSGLLKGLGLMLAKKRAVRWAYRNGPVSSLHVAPLEGADVLHDILWGSERALVAMVSATLQDFDGFSRFKSRTGAPSLRTAVVEPIFPYRENTLFIVTMNSSPRYEEKDAYEQDLRKNLPQFIDKAEGTLVLFPSRALMHKTIPELELQFGKDMVLVQGAMGIKELIKVHKDRIDEGKGSILCGLATLAEGLDLPGKYCTHVAICALPFAVPTSPVEQELQEILGKDYFAQRALPDALIKLIQMVGRLMRRESDRGKITVYDKRLMYTAWGRKMLNALPNFKVKPIAPAVTEKKSETVINLVPE